MNIDKLPSGSYRIRQQYKGKRYSITLPYKPSVREAEEIIRSQHRNVALGGFTTFYQAGCEYVEVKRNVISPGTVRNYTQILNSLPQWFKDMNISKIEPRHIQKVVNELAISLSPKSVKNYYGVITAVFKHLDPTYVVNATLPQRISSEVYIPTEEEVKKILEYTDEHNPEYYIPIALAASCGMRREEIIALLPEKIVDGMIRIDSAIVLDEKNNWVRKTTKTVNSTRWVPISPDLEKRIKDQGYAYNMFPNSAARYLLRVEEILGIQKFTFHKLRHFYASMLLAQGVPMKDVASLGGWSSLTTLEKIYAHTMLTRTNEQKKEISSRLWKTIF